MKEIRAFPVVMITTAEPLRAVSDIATAWADQAVVLVWDVSAGVQTFEDWQSLTGSPRRGGSDPLAPCRALNEANDDTVLIAIHYHLVLKSPPVIQALLDGAANWSGALRRLVIVAPPGTTVPPEIERYVVVLPHDLPDVVALTAIVEANAAANGLDLDSDEAAALGRLGRGLSAFEFVNALALSIAEHGAILPDEIAHQKQNLVRKNSVLEWSRTDWSFQDVGGLAVVKNFLRATARHDLARGTLMLGVPGVGKTMVAKALANEIGVPALQFEFSRVFGSLVGESEQKIHAALRVVEAMAPAILIVDEIEKGLAGVSSSHRSDGGTAARVGETFLTWLNDRPAGSGIYVVATCNDVSKLPPEFIRAERWDAMFFFDVPSAAERNDIARLYANKYDIPIDPRPDEAGWTGAEIASAYRVAAMLDTDAAAASQYIVPLSRTMREQIDALRDWANGRCVPASATAATGDGNGGLVRRVV